MKRARRGARKVVPKPSGAPILTTPESAMSAPPISLWMESASVSMLSARASSRSPCGVSA